MTEILYYIIIIILILEFLLEIYLEYLNVKNAKTEVPTELKGYYNEEKFALQQKYEKDSTVFGLIKSSLSFTLTFVVVCCGFLGIADDWLRHYYIDEFWLSILWFVGFGVIMFIFSLPFSWYDTFVIEEKYGFNKTSYKTFILDTIKSIVLATVIGLPILMFVIWFYLHTGIWFVLYVFILIISVSLFFTFFYSNLIVPLFNKQIPLEDGELRNAIEIFCKNAGFKLKNVYTIDGSKRSSKANAYFTGFGSKKRIVLYDTLIKDLSTEEIVAVLAHETGHYKKKHVPYNILLSFFQTAAMLLLLYFALKIPELSYALGGKTHSFYLGITAFGILLTPVSMITGLFSGMLSRKFEFQADAFASEHGFGNHLASALKKLSVNNLSNLYPHPLYVIFHYSHPPILERLKRLS